MKHTIQKGFTLIEMLTVLAIFSILTSITIFNYSKFRSDTILTNMAYEVALSIREAQIYGVSARNVIESGTPNYTIPYGIYTPKNSKEYYLIADNNRNNTFNGTCNSTDDSCVKTYTMQNNISITDLQYKINSNPNCSPENDALTFLFKRPNPEPIISKNSGLGNSDNISVAVITLSASEGSSRHVVVYNNGQISVVNDLEDANICN